MNDSIPLEARIVTVADIFDALTSDRPYKRKWAVDEALEELDRMVKAGKLDRCCVAALRQNLAQIHTIREHYQDQDAVSPTYDE